MGLVFSTLGGACIHAHGGLSKSIDGRGGHCGLGDLNMPNKTNYLP